ncbi:unnamed protein product [Lathyrus sativus]|nr:unnamed protein product [Lathyrus sativus]
MENKKLGELYLRYSNTILVSLAKNILANVLSTASVKNLWEKLEGLYQKKVILNQLLLKGHFHSLCMDEHRKIFSHLCVTNGTVYVLGWPKELTIQAKRK